MARAPRDSVRPLQHSAGTTAGKTVIKAVVSHQRLITEIEARNPIIANRQKATRSRAQPMASNR